MSECAGNCNGKCEGSRVLSKAVRDTGGEQWSGNTYTPGLYPTPLYRDDEPAQEKSNLELAMTQLDASLDQLGKAIAAATERLDFITSHRPIESVLVGGESPCSITVSVESALLVGIHGAQTRVDEYRERVYRLLERLDV